MSATPSICAALASPGGEPAGFSEAVTMAWPGTRCGATFDLSHSANAGFDRRSASTGPETLVAGGTNLDWAKLVLIDGGWPLTDENVTFMMRWMRQENGAPYPFRRVGTRQGQRIYTGYSDHFPVCVTVEARP